jgi:hypothetical protein
MAAGLGIVSVATFLVGTVSAFSEERIARKVIPV